MDSFCGRSRFLLCALPLLLITAFITPVGAQGLIGAGLPGTPYSSGSLGGSAGCGQKLCPSIGAPVIYIGWMDNRQGTVIDFNTTGAAISGVTRLQQRYPNSGVWFGLSESVCLSDWLSFVASGWYLVPSKGTSQEEFTFDGGSPPGGRKWDTDPQWWFVDGLVSVGSSGGNLTVLAGIRYDYYTNRFKNESNVFGIDNLPSDTADIISESWIPLFGAQYAYTGSTGSLIVRAVGVPTLLGNVKYNENADGFRINSKGTYKNGYFLELFGEYSRKLGPGSVGLFGRWNTAEGKSDMNFEVPPSPGDETYHLTVHRYSWTVGGSFSLAF